MSYNFKGVRTRPPPSAKELARSRQLAAVDHARRILAMGWEVPKEVLEKMSIGDRFTFIKRKPERTDD